MPVVINGTTGISGVDGSAGTPAVQGTDTNTGVFFPAADTIAFSEGGTEVARFDSAGNLGIGTSSPANKLHVAGNVTLADYANIGATNNNAGISLTGGNATNNGGQINLRGGSFSGNANGIEFIGGGTERARIDSSGRFLVGTTSSLDDNSRGQFLSTTHALQAQCNATDGGWYALKCVRIGSTGKFVGFVYGNQSTEVGSISTGGTTTAYNTSSDYRLKHDIAPMTGALAKVAALKPCTYKWNVDGSDGEGFIAHELAEVCPDAVTGEKDAVDEDGNPKYQGIDTSFLVATLTAAIQELKAIVDAQAVEIAQLKGQA